MQKSAKFKPVMPENFTPEEWNRLTPREQAQYATNPTLFKPGESGKRRVLRSGPKPEKRPVGRPRKGGQEPKNSREVEVVHAIISGQPMPPPAGDVPAVVHQPSFVVEPAESVKECIDTNGLALLNDAYGRASRAHSSGDPFDRAVYLTLIGKAHPMASLSSDKPLAGTAKKQMRLLSKLLAQQDVQDGEFRTVEAHEQPG